MPAGGRLLGFVPPEGPGVRNDVGVEVGDEVSLFYDPMISKLIVHAQDRPAAVRRLGRALDDYAVLGVPTNLPLLRRIAAHPAFAAGETTTRFLEEHTAHRNRNPSRPFPREAVLLAAAAELCKRARVPGTLRGRTLATARCLPPPVPGRGRHARGRGRALGRSA